MEVRHRFGREDQRTLPRLDNGERLLHRAVGGDGVVRARRNAFTTTDAVLLDDLHHSRLRRKRDGIGRTDPDTRQASDTPRWIDVETQDNPEIDGERRMSVGTLRTGALASWRND